MMGKQPQKERKWNLHLLFSVVLFSVSSFALERKVSATSTRDTGSSIRSSSLELHHPPLVHHLFSSDEALPPSDIAALPDVSVICARSDFVVRVKAHFYGLDAHPSELRLGSTCLSNAPGPHGDYLFIYPLTACDSQLELFPGYLAYKFVLHYDPFPGPFPSKTHPVTVNIECRYPRNYHMHKLVIQPTWETHLVHRRLKTSQNNFQIQLMDDTWEHFVQSRVFQLREIVNFQVLATHLPPGQKLYISSCYATPITQPKSPIKFTIIDNYGCLLDSKIDPGSSKFISRTDERIRFSMKAFQFVTAPEAEISMHCQLYVTTAGPSPAHKSCTYTLNSWEALSGDDAICKCCDSQCVTSKQHRAMMDGIISSGSLWVSTHFDSSKSGVKTSAVDKMHEASDPKQMLSGENDDALENMEDTSRVKEIKSARKEIKWSTDQHEKDLALKLQKVTTQTLDYQRSKPDAAIKEEAAEPLETGGEKESQKPADVSVKEGIKEVFKPDNDDSDELDGNKTWYFAWR